MAKATIIQRLKGAAGGTSGSKRMLIVVPAAAIVAGTLWALSGDPKGVVKSTLPAPDPSTRTLQGGVAPSQQMSQELRDADATRIKEASVQGASAIPTVQLTPVAPVATPEEDRSRLLDGEGIQRPAPPVIERPQIVAPPPMAAAPMPVQYVPNGEPDPAIEQTRRYLESIKNAYPAAEVKYYFKGPAPGAPDLSGAQAQVAAAVNPALLDPASGIKLPLPGTIVYATMITSANSDTPGPVTAQIVTGELAGATLVGSFTTQREGMFVSFTTLSMGRTRDGDEINRAIPISAVAVDSKTVGTGLATDVDRHLLTNVGITAAAAFMQGLGQAVATSGQTYSQTLGGTTVVNPTRTLRDQMYIGGGAGAAAGGQALVQAYGNRPPTVTLAAGTPVGILFLSNGASGN